MRSGRPERPTKADSQTWLVFTPFFPFTLPSLMLSVSLSLISLILHPRSGSCLCARTAAAVQGIGLVGAGGGLGITLARRSLTMTFAGLSADRGSTWDDSQ